MKPPFSILIALITSSLAWTSESEWVSCEKTYICPENVSLELHKIEVKSQGALIQTSAIYSDRIGLYYKDFLETKTEEVVTVIEDISSPIEELVEEDIATIYSDEPSELFDAPEEEIFFEDPLPVASITKENSSKTPHVWPYAEKQR